VGIRPERAEVSGAQVVVADQLELVIVRLIWTDGAAAGWPADGLAWPLALPVFCLASPHIGVVFVSGLRMRVVPCRVLAHGYLRCWPSAGPARITCPVRPRFRQVPD
jgi:hypothetical protein